MSLGVCELHIFQHIYIYTYCKARAYSFTRTAVYIEGYFLKGDFGENSFLHGNCTGWGRSIIYPDENNLIFTML